MREVLTVGHEHQGHKFDVHVTYMPAGYTYFVDIHFPGSEVLQINSGDDIYKDADRAHHAARFRAWAVIEEFVKASAP